MSVKKIGLVVISAALLSTGVAMGSWTPPPPSGPLWGIENNSDINHLAHHDGSLVPVEGLKEAYGALNLGGGFGVVGLRHKNGQILPVQNLGGGFGVVGLQPYYPVQNIGGGFGVVGVGNATHLVACSVKGVTLRSGSVEECEKAGGKVREMAMGMKE